MITGEMCQALAIPMTSSFSAFVWQTILYLWPWKWIWVVLAIGAWTVWEIFTRNGSEHFNSKNGFSPLFNIFVGSGTFAILQSTWTIILDKFFGEVVYCVSWPYVGHFIIFPLTGILLHVVGFWPELRIFKNRKYVKNFYYRKHRRKRY